MLNKKKFKLSIIFILLIFIFTTSSIVAAESIHKNIFEEISAENIYKHISILTSDDTRILF
ncbi:MAG TPA: hypothetical protein VK071_09540 [Tissierellales bacterium]|nr:hypothetical protein [Tissierellales bacterium]